MRSESMRRRATVAGVFTLAMVLRTNGFIDAQTIEIERDEAGFTVEVVKIVPLSLGDREMMGELADAVSLFKGKVDDAAIRKAVADSNVKTARMKPTELAALSESWAKSTNSTAMVTAVVDAPCSAVLRSFRDTFRDFALLLVVDRSGVVVCASERPKRHDFAGESWLNTVLDPAGMDGAMGAAIRDPTANHGPQTPIMVAVRDPETGQRIGGGLALVNAVVAM